MREYKSALGHICTGGGAEINNSPINIHIHIHSNDATIAQKIGRSISGIFGKRHETISGASQLSEADIQRGISRTIQG